MIITGMDHFQSVCKKKLVEWYNNNGRVDAPQIPQIDLSNVFIVWSCKNLQNYKCLASTTVSGDVKKFPTRYFLNILGYEVQEYEYLDYHAPIDAPQNLFSED